MAGRWGSSCAALLPTPMPGLVDGHGKPMDNFSNTLTWGIDLYTCNKYCNITALGVPFHFDDFSSSFLNFILPWVALTAQLPYQTGHPMSDLVSFCLTLGSPALVTFSLGMTILNRLLIRQRFDELYNRARALGVGKRYPELASRVRNIQFLLQEAQQVPMRVSQKDGWLSSLIVCSQNRDWWEKLEKSLNNTRRDVTFSYIAQMLAAIIAWIITIIAAYLGSLGDLSTALQVAAGSLWTWMIPILIGWVTVGTQTSSRTINEALAAEVAYRALETPAEKSKIITKGQQHGLVVGLDLVQDGHEEGIDDLPLAVAGDELKSGPIYNYARALTYWHFTNSVHDALSTLVKNVKDGKACRKRSEANGSFKIGKSTDLRHGDVGNFSVDIRQDNDESENMPWDINLKPEENLEGTCSETAAYCGLSGEKVPAYPRLESVPLHVKKNIFAAVLFALFLQWGTTGPSMMISYLTPVVGMGCRASGQLVYGIFGTMVLLLLLVSMFMSHLAVLEYQDPRQRSCCEDQETSRNVRSARHKMYCRVAIITRGLGKFVAMLNTLLLLTAGLLETTRNV